MTQFEWDKKKAAENQRKHGISFEEASTVFYDPEHSIAEHRLITVGLSARHRLLVVSYMERGKYLRIISARPATSLERKRHES